MVRARGRQGRRLLRAIAVGIAMVAATASSAGAAGITNSGNDLRDGWYPNQPKLSPDAVAASNFGRLWTKQLDGQIYAQPLVLGNRVIVATEHNKVYSLDSETGDVKWTADLGPSFPAANIGWGCSDLWPDLGVTSTPVIDTVTNTIYTTHKTYSPDPEKPTEAAYYMDALDASTGIQRDGFPRLLEGTAQNTPDQSFQATTELQRPGLLLMGGVVYAGFGGHCDIPPYTGWVFGVSASTGDIKARWATLLKGDGAGIWQSGAGLMSDGPGRLFVSTGNGGSPKTASDTPSGYFGESIVRLGVQSDGTLKAQDFFAPGDAAHLDDYDADFASGGVTALRDDLFGTSQHPHLGVAVGKAGYVYLLDRDDLGGFQMGVGHGDDVVARVGPYGGVWSRPGVWPGDGGWIAIPTASPGGGENPDPTGSAGFLKVYRYRVSAGGVPSLDAPVQSDDPFGFSSGAPVITSDGMTSGSAVLWIIWSPDGSGQNAQLRAYDPVPRGGKLVLKKSWPIGTSSKFAMAGVGAGRMYVGNRGGKVYGFGAPVVASLTAPATTFPTTTVGESRTMNVTLTAGKTVKVTGVSAGGAFSAATGGLGLPKTLSAGQTLTVPVTFTPASTGSTGGALSVSTDLDAQPLAFSLSGTGQAAAAMLTASAPVISFGGAIVGEDHASTVTFSNTGGQPLTVQSVELPGAPFSVTGAPAAGDPIDPGEAVNVTVSYRPTAVGEYNDELVLNTTAGSKTVGLSGTAGVGPKLSLSPSDGWQFGDVVVGTSKTASVVVSNTGDSAMSVTKSKAPTGSAFSVVSGLDEGITIAAGGSRTVTVKFTPAARGTVSDAWTLNATDGTGVHTVPVVGRGLAAAKLTGPASANVGDVVLGSSGTAAVTFGNAGDVPLTLSGVDLPAAPFSVTDAPPSGTAIPAGGSLTVHVAFAAGAPGAATGSLVLHSTGGDLTVPLSARAVTSGEVDLGSDWAFGDVTLGETTTKTFTVKNRGSAPLTIRASTPPADARFTVAGDPLPVGLTLAPGASRAVTIAFTPTGEGDATAYWSLATTAAAGVQLIPLTARGVAPPPVVVDPDPDPTPDVTPPAPIAPPVAPQEPVTPQGPVAPAPVAKAHPRLTVSRPKLSRDGRTIALRGYVARTATGALTVRLKARAGRKTITSVSSIRLRGKSTYSGVLKLAKTSVKWSRLEIQVAYAGDGRVRAGSSTFVLVRAPRS
jgi:hypothetical protein